MASSIGMVCKHFLSFGPSPFNFWPHRPRNSGYYDLC